MGERPVAIEPSSPARIASTAATLVHLVYDEETDRRALERVAGRLARDLVTTRIDLVSSDAGAVSTLVTRGSGLPTCLGPRTLESGLLIAEDVEGGGHEIGVPIRLGTRLVAALVCRWPLDRLPPPQAAELLELAAAVAAPRADALLVSPPRGIARVNGCARADWRQRRDAGGSARDRARRQGAVLPC